MAFASKWIRDPQDIYSIDIPRRLESVPIEWAGKWKKVPLLRRSVRDSTGKVYTSPDLASQYNQMAMWNRRLGRSFGMKETFQFKNIQVLFRCIELRKEPFQNRGYQNIRIDLRSF
jgi:Protein of unknown function (DUF3435)